MTIGRPSIKTPELVDEICQRIAEGRSVASVARDDDMPDHKTIWRWLNADEAFGQRYARAIQARAMAHADRIADVTAGVLAGQIQPDAARVALDGMKWTASRLLPKVYGDRTQIDATVTHTHTLHLEALKELANRASGTQSGYIEAQAIDISSDLTLHGEGQPASQALPAPPAGPFGADPAPDPPGPAPRRGARARAPTAPATDLPEKSIRPPRPPSRAKRAAVEK